MNTILKQVISLVLCFVLVVGYVPASAFATETGETVTTETTAVTTETTEESSEETEAPSESTEAPAVQSVEADGSDEEKKSEKESKKAEKEAEKEAKKEEKESKKETEPSTEPSTEATVPVTEETVPVTEETVPATEETVPATTEATVPETTEETVPETTVETRPALMMMAPAPKAAPEHVDAAIFFSDLHTKSSDYKQSTVNGIMTAMKNTGLSFSSVTSCGDAFSVNQDSGKYTGKTSTITGYIQNVLGNVPVNYVWSDHDRYAVQLDDSTLLDNDSGFIYGAGADGTYGTADDGNYYIYELSMADLSTNNRYNADFHTNEEVTAAIAEFTSDAAALKKDRPLFIASHQPLLDRRNDNGHALEWATAINAVAETMDVAFFFGHNHNYDVEKDYYYAKGETMSVCKDSSGNAQDVVLNFTHMCTGYMAPSSTGSTSSTTRQGVVVAVTIFEDEIGYVTYDASGVYTGNYALNETVKRDHAVAEPEEPVVTLQSIAVTAAPTKTAYTVGETFDAAGLVVTATYSDGTAPQVTDYTLSEVDMTTAGTKTVTVTFQDKTATFEITVAEAAPETSEPVEDINGTGITVAAPGITEVAVSVIEAPEYDAQVYTAYASYDIAVQGHENGVEATVTLPAPAHFDVNRPVLVLYAGEVIATTSIVEGKITFTTNHFSVYDVAQTAEGDLEWVYISTSSGDAYYELATSVESGETYLIASGPSNSVSLLNKNGGSSDNVPVSDSRITSGGADYEWTFTAFGDGYTIRDTDNQYLYPHANYNKKNGWSYSLVANGALTAAKVDVNGSSGATTISRSVTSGKNGSTTAYLIYSSGFGASDSSGNLYLFKKMSQPGDSVYAAMDGQPEFHFSVGSYNEAAIHQAIAVYTATDATGTGNTLTDDYDLVGTVNGGVAGTYELSVQYGGKELGKLTVVVSSDPYLKITHDGKEKELVYEKQVVVGDTVQLGVDAFTGTETAANPNVTWTIPEEYADMAEADNTGKVTFKVDRANFLVKASWTVNGEELTDTIQIIITPDTYLTPGTSTNDFPEYPNQGAIRYDKTAESVGNFSETGVTQMELSMTGIPYSAPKKLDVVLMLDRSSSMYKTGVQHRISSTIAATKVFVENVVKNKDGSFNDNRIIVMDFLGGNLAEGNQHQYQSNLYTLSEESGYEIISSQDELEALFARIDNGFKGQTSLYGTEYAQGLEDCYNALAQSRADGNQQFCVFMSDGIPNYMKCETTHFEKTSDIVAMFTGTPSNETNPNMSRGSNYEYEYYSTQMKNEGVTVYTVGLGLKNTNSAWSGAKALACEQVANMLLNDISGPAGETADDRDTGAAVSKLDKYFFSVADTNAAEDMKNVFTNIASQIMQAATDIVVTDKITEQYHMIFDVPKSTYTEDGKAAERDAAVAAALANQDLYIEVVNYTLDANHERTTTVDTLTRVYLKDSNGTTAGGTYSAATDANGTAAAAPTFTAKTEGKRGYWSVFTGTAGENDIVITVDGTTWKFMEKGDGTHNVTAGAYAFGNIDTKTNRSEDLVIVTPYFAYSAKTKMLAWTADKVEEFKELALRYFLYLDASSTEIGTPIETDPGSYLTNEWAYITYTNHLGNECRREFPKPQMTWNGAQVSYVFYLVNENGEPINKAGEKVDFANATFITDVFTESVVWNDTDTPTQEGRAFLEAQWKAKDKLPEGYTLYDQEAYYELKVYEDHTGNILDNYFKIAGSEANGATASTTKVYNTKAGAKHSGYGTYTAKASDNFDDEIILEEFDFANTTVAFAVVWKLQLNPDTVVVDYGLDVLVNVVENDLMSNTLTGISKNARSNLTMNTGIAGNAAFTSQTLDYADYVFSVEGENQIRFHQKNMQFDAPETIYYESKSTDYINGTARTGYMYSSLTVIPATTIYYEDEYVDLKSYTVDGETTTEDDPSQWTTAGTTASATQDQDRPGASQISAALDADNNYGYDSAYTSMSTYSMGSAAKINVNANIRGEATFTFYGTGFDIIGLTSNTTGTLTVQVYSGAAASGTAVKTSVVDTYFSYAQALFKVTYTYDADTQTWNESIEQVETEGTSNTKPENPTDGAKYTTFETRWVVSNNDPNALYQVPVMKIFGLDYGQYTVKLTAGYNEYFDHTGTANDDGTKDGYDLYLDAVRIYDPTGVASGNTTNDTNGVVSDAYVADGEGWPIYKELRNLIIAANSFGSDVTVNSGDYSATTTVNGVVFIDGVDKNTSIKDYTSYGPNNELYLAPGQSIAFKINDAFVDSDGNSVTPVDVQIAVKSVGSSANIEMFNPGIKVTTTTEGTTTTTTTSASKDDLIAETITTATDMYYSIEALTDDTIVISNPGESGILSITNIKFTFDKAASVKTETTTNEETGEETVSTASVVSISEAGAVYAMRSLSAYTATETVVEETTEPETTEPSEPETSEPETSEPETSEPETTVPEETEPEETVPETTEPENSEQEQIEEAVKEAVTTIVNTVVNALKNLFSKWFR